MTELKTLKDLTPIQWKEINGTKTDQLISIKELRQEAINWCKDYIKNTQNILSEENLKWNRTIRSVSPTQAAELIQHQGVVWFIKQFFNLTEEDLKNE